jgi:hypothetical protein
MSKDKDKEPQPKQANDGQHVAVASNLLTQVPPLGSPDPKVPNELSKTSTAGTITDKELEDLELVIKLQEPHASASSPSEATLTILHNFDFKILAMLVNKT